ncbi:hypothetical protein ACWF0M_11400 [Kribbella sp. NPDC055110]
MAPHTVQVESSRLATARATCSGRTTHSVEVEVEVLVEVVVAARSLLLGRDLPAS